jgi:hypothetical protein
VSPTSAAYWRLSLALIATLLVGSVVVSLLVRSRAQPSVAPPRSKEPAPW